MIKNFEKFNETFGDSFLSKIKEFSNKIKDVIEQGKDLLNDYSYKELKISSIKDLTKIRLDRSTFRKIKELYQQNKEKIDSSYNLVFDNKINEELNFMVKGLIYIILFFSIISCVDVTKKSEPITLKITHKEYVPSSSKWCYHYGYNGFRGKFEWHWGNEIEPEKFYVTLSNGSVINDRNAYNSGEEGDSLPFYKVNFYVDGKFRSSTIVKRSWTDGKKTEIDKRTLDIFPEYGNFKPVKEK